ncbi:MAG: TetR/AcrR family transcriptional regulator [Actinomycetota bacterium]|jgi:TetR/AcrR family transcriptional regulator, cholesterol catabolism regulator|nr:TetR/AcrR family transcriptional regulator [Actinomycetota bacterium]
MSRKLTTPTKPTPGIAKRRATAQAEGTEAYQERRAEIIRAAAKVFHRKGYTGTTIGAVAELLDTDRASLYYYISGKDELFDDVVREVTEVNVATALAIRDGDDPAPAKLRSIIEALMASYADTYPMLYVYMRENLTEVDGPRQGWSRYMRSMNKQYENAVIDIVQQGFDEGTLRRTGEARVVAFGIIGMVGWTNRWFSPDRSAESHQEVARTFADTVLDGLASGAVGAEEMTP